MAGLIEDGQIVTITPVQADTEIRKGDIVLCRVRGREYLHKVLAVSDRGFLIGNNRGGVNGWTMHVYGRVAIKEDGHAPK